MRLLHQPFQALIDTIASFIVSMGEVVNNGPSDSNWGPPFPAVIETKFVPKSSFAAKRQLRISKADLLPATRIWYPLFCAVPSVARLLLLARDRQRGQWNPLCWRLLKIKYMPDRFAASLEQTGDVTLRKMLFGDHSADARDTGDKCGIGQ